MDPFVADAIFIDAPPGRVFAALLDPQDILEWFEAETATVAGEEGGGFEVARLDGSTLRGTISALEPESSLEISDYYHEDAGVSRGPMRVRFLLQPHDGGVWLTVRQDDLDCGEGWEIFAQRARREWVKATVALKRHIEQI